MIHVNDNFSLGSKGFLDSRQSVVDLDELLTLNTNTIPDGFEVYIENLDMKYRYNSNYNETDTGHWKLMISDGGNNTAEGITYENADYPDLTNVGVTLDNILSKIYYVKPTCSLSASPTGGTFEMGTTITAPITFTWTTNKPITTQTLTGCTLADETVRTATYDENISSDKSFTLTVSDYENSASSTVSYKFMNKVHHGATSIPDAYDSTFIFSLGGALKGNKNGSYTANVGDGQYFYIAMPTSYNNSDTLTGKIGGFDTDFGKVATIEHTNASGYTCDYNIYKSTNANLGSITMTI